MDAIKNITTNFILGAAAFAAIGAALVMPGQASAGNTDGPWPEPPSCSNETGTCTSIEDQLAYECFFESDDFLIKWCDDPMVEMRKDTNVLVAPQGHPDPTPKGLVAPTARR